ncbi:MAG: hypothetical protein E5X16_00340 [Mesorhizobium sp.]|nr:MAG: hypothetical protein E5X16_00340 [Mesorhizobium sp.]
MKGNIGERRAKLADDIRRQVGTEATKRLLRTLPAFRLEKEVPKQFTDLLDRLDGGRPAAALDRPSPVPQRKALRSYAALRSSRIRASP